MLFIQTIYHQRDTEGHAPTAEGMDDTAVDDGVDDNVININGINVHTDDNQTDTNVPLTYHQNFQVARDKVGNLLGINIVENRTG